MTEDAARVSVAVAVPPAMRDRTCTRSAV